MRKRFVEASALLMRSDGTCLLSPFFTTTFTSFFVSFLAEATWKGISWQLYNVNESWILVSFCVYSSYIYVQLIQIAKTINAVSPKCKRLKIPFSPSFLPEEVLALE